jgi:hypothetical protein
MKKIVLIIALLVLTASMVSAGDISAGTIATQDGDPAENISFTLTFTNSGAADIVVSSTSSDLTQGTSTIDAPTIADVTVPTGDTADATFTITVPSTISGDYDGTVSYTSTGGSGTVGYTLKVNSVKDFNVSEVSLAIESEGDAESDTFVITNSGSETLTGWSLSFESDDGDTGVIKDSNDDEIAISLTGANSSLAPGDTMTITVTADPDSEINYGTYRGDITVSATGATSETVSLDVTIASDICENGKVGDDFEIDIRNPDSGDEFVPGDIIPMEVRVENVGSDDLDVEMEITLYDQDTGEKVDKVTEKGSIDEDESETFNVDFELPADMDVGDQYEIFVQVHDIDAGEDESCDYESVEIDVSREDESAVITKASLTPTIGLVCGDEYRVTLYVESTGDDEISGLFVELLDGDLEVKESSESFDLGDYNDDDNEEKISFDLSLPKKIDEGTYYLEATLYNENGKEIDNELINVEVTSCSEQDQVGDLGVQVSEEYTVKNDELTLSLIITNNGDDNAVITMTPDDTSWATLTGTEYLTKLNSGDETHAYLYYTLDTDTTGKHDLKITITDDRGNEVSDVVTVDFGEEASENPSEIGKWLSENVSFWTIADIILVILAITFLVMFLSKK